MSSRRRIRVATFVPLLLLAGFCAEGGAATTVQADLYQVGLAQVDVTPDYPIRLSGFGFRRTESEGVTQRIWAKAIAIGAAGQPPVLLVTVENCGVPAPIVEALRDKLQADLKLPRERVALSFTHTHTGPMLSDSLATLFGLPIPAEHQRHIDRYTRELADRLESVARAALRDVRPARLEWGIGAVDFALNRRTRGGPVDHDLPVLIVRGEENKVRGVLVSYACHCVTLSNNRISGDWAGYAMESLQRDLPGAVALVTIGCGADQNPNSGVTGDRAEVAAAQGQAIAAEVKRLIGGFLAPVSGSIVGQWATIELPLSPSPTRVEWEDRAKRDDAIGYHARVQLGRLDRGESLRARFDYPVQTWSFGESLAMVFLPGEVVVDYATRLKRELDGRRLWIHAYSNDAPGYVPSERILKEGGYEGGGAMVYYDIPSAYATGLEDKIVAAVHAQVGREFLSPHEPGKLQGTRPLSPQQSLATMRVGEELAVELVVAEPLVIDPVAIDFGMSGELWVAEMQDYPAGLAGDYEPGGRVRLVRDTDGDGRFDRSTLFLDKIPFPTGVLVWRKGVLVCAAPDILYAEDTDGDDRADLVRKAFTGFGAGNYQARVNSLTFGLDGWVYGSCGLFGGRIENFRGAPPLDLGDRDFRLRPDDGLIESATGRTQQSRVRDDWDNWFGCDNSNLGRHYPLPDHYLRRNPHVALPANSVNLATDADAARLTPARLESQRFKLSGAPAGVTAACGIGVYRDERFGPDWSGNVFTCEPVNLLVHRLRLEPQGSTFRGRRAAEEADREFFASTDNWSRPVQARTGPDGALWVVDMYRFVIEHPRWIPAEDLARLDVRAGSTLGRIYRVKPRGGAPLAPPRLDRMDLAALVDSLRSSNGVVRDLASQQIMWRLSRSELTASTSSSADVAQPDRRTAQDALRALLADRDASALARLHSLCLLDRLDLIAPHDVLGALSDPHPGVRRHAVRISERWSAEASSPLSAPLLQRIDDPDPQVQLQLALTLGQWRTLNTGAALGKLAARHSDDAYLTAAVLSSLHAGNIAAAVDEVVLRGDVESSPQGLLTQLVQVATALSESGPPATLLQRIAQPREGRFAAWQFSAVAGMLDALARRKRWLTDLPAADQASVEEILTSARRLASDEARTLVERTAAIGMLGRDPRSAAADTRQLAALLVPQTTASLQSAAIAALARSGAPQVADTILGNWASYTPSLRAQAFDLLLSRPEWQRELLDRLEKASVAPATLDAAQRQRLEQLDDATLRGRALRIFASASNVARATVVKEHQDVLGMKGDRVRGAAAFARVCANCHRWKETGHAVGPDLAALAHKTPAALLVEILDPNRNVDSRYLQYSAVNGNGQSYFGLMAGETATSITLLGPNGVRQELLRADLEQLRGLGNSLMPEGLERDLKKQDLADVLTFLATGTAAPKTFPGNAPAITRPENGQLALTATVAEIYGGEIVFETPFRNIGFWHGAQDHVAWSVQTPQDDDYDVYLDASCAPDSAGNAFVIEGGQTPIRGAVESTGGWDQYRLRKVGAVRLPAGHSRILMRPDAAPRGALADVRGLYLTARGQPPRLQLASGIPERRQPPATPAGLAEFLLDDQQPAAARQAAIAERRAESAELIAQMVRLLPRDANEEYRRIPWIWRVAIAAGKRQDPASWIKILDVSLPQVGEPLRDWQAVVIGGGLINGMSQQNLWPREQIELLLRERPTLAARWRLAMEQSAAMADDEKVPAGTRYDALRMLPLAGWEQRGRQLVRYLEREVDPELQRGAISGLSDIDAPEVADVLLHHLADFSAANRKLAFDALLRTNARIESLRKAVDEKRVEIEQLSPPQREKLGR